MGRGEVPKKCRDIRTQENRDPVILEIPRIDLSHKSREDTCQNPGGSRNSENRSSRARRNLVTRNRDPRIHDKIWTVHLVDTWQRSAPSGKVPIERSLIGNWDLRIREIRSRGDKESMRCETSNAETPMKGLTMIAR